MINILLQIILIILLALFSIKFYFKLTTGWCKTYTCLIGKTVIITGANAGIGYATALNLAMRGAKIILACRDEIKANQARKQIISETKNPNIFVKLVDLKSLESVKKFAEDIDEKLEKIDILINNAGVAEKDLRVTDDGFNEVMLVNYFAPTYLTLLLLDKLKKSGPSRIINVSSVIAKYDKHFNPIEPNNCQIKWVYSNSKLCNIFFTQKLAKYLDGTGVTVHSLHPGLIITNVLKPLKDIAPAILFFMGFFAKTAEEGAQTTIHLATVDSLSKLNGRHFVDCKLVPSYKTAKNLTNEQLLWDTTLKLLKIDPKTVKLFDQ